MAGNRWKGNESICENELKKIKDKWSGKLEAELVNK